MAFHGRRRILLALVAIAGGALLVASTGAGAPDQRKRGGTLRIISAGDVDSVDPGQTYYAFGWQVLHAVHRTLYSTPANRTAPVPDLAAGQPRISGGGRTVTVQIKRGIRFGPPVNREVTAADVKYAIERSFSASVPNGYASLYFTSIVGVPAAPPKTPKPISGIRTPDRYTIQFRLKEPSTTLLGALSMTNTAPVPKEYAASHDNKTTSDYPFFQVGTGPYRFEADGSGSIRGRGYTPGRRMRLVRNPSWNRSTDYRPAYADVIEVREGFTDNSVGTRQILSGTADASGDFGPPPPLIRQLTTDPKLKDNLFQWSNGTNYIAINTKKKPFDNRNVRRAVNFVVDKNAVRLAAGGPIQGPIATHFLGPEFKGNGFEEAGGLRYDPFRSRSFSGDVNKAKAEMRRAGYADGMYDGPAITAIVANSSPSPEQARVIQASLEKIGIEMRIRLVSIDAMFTRFCVVPKNQPELCPSVGWLPDFKDPVTMLDPVFNGRNILPTNNVNMSQLNDRVVNAAMERAKRIKSLKARLRAWGRIDKMITERAAIVPLLWPSTLNVTSDRIVPARMLWNAGALDLTATSIK